MKKRILTLLITSVLMLTLIPAVPVTLVQAEDVYLRVLLKPTLEFDEIADFSGGLAPVRIGDKWGVIDKTGKVVIPIEYGWVYPFSEGLALANKGGILANSGAMNGGSWGFIDKKGNVVIPFEYDDLSKSFCEGLAAVKKGDKWGFINKQGRVVAPFEYDWASDFNEGLAAVRKGYSKNAQHGFINKNGKIAISLQYEGAESFSDGLAAVQKGRGKDALHGYIDKKGNVVIPFEYDIPGPFSEGFAAVMKGSTYSILDKTGQAVATIGKYDSVEEFKNGLAVAKKNGKWGYIDTAGKVIVPISYDWGYDFTDGFARVDKNDKQGYIDTSGKVVVPLEYSLARDFNEGLAAVRIGPPKNCKWGILEMTTQDPSSAELESKPEAAVPDKQQPEAATVLTATANASAVTVNEKKVDFDAYTINQNNYFKLRDLAYILNGTEKQFEVGYDNKTQAIILTSGQPYTPVGGEMADKSGGSKTPVPTASKTYLDGRELALTAYTIGNNNYFKLRDLGEALDFGIEWDQVSSTIVIDTSKGYTP